MPGTREGLSGACSRYSGGDLVAEHGGQALSLRSVAIGAMHSFHGKTAVVLFKVKFRELCRCWCGDGVQVLCKMSANQSIRSTSG